MTTRDKSGRFLKQSRSEQYRLMRERLAYETWGTVPTEWQVLKTVPYEPALEWWWVRT